MSNTKGMLANIVHSADAVRMNLEEWLDAYSNGWTNRDRLICNASESGADREGGYDEEQYQEEAYINEYCAPREASTTMRGIMT